MPVNKRASLTDDRGRSRFLLLVVRVATTGEPKSIMHRIFFLVKFWVSSKWVRSRASQALHLSLDTYHAKLKNPTISVGKDRSRQILRGSAACLIVRRKPQVGISIKQEVISANERQTNQPADNEEIRQFGAT